jgi:alkylated DNA repair dioxygenase AlkB
MSSRDQEQTMALPAGFIYEEEFLSRQEENELLTDIGTLDFETFEYRGFAAKRRVLAYGWRYDFNSNVLSPGPPIPEFLLPLRSRAAAAAELAPEELEEALLTEYSPGAPINWHRDLPMFEKVIGISLLSSCTMKLKSFKKEAKALSITLQPRSLYIMQGTARWQYQHSIPAVKDLRYSITFRSLKK